MRYDYSAINYADLYGYYTGIYNSDRFNRFHNGDIESVPGLSVVEAFLSTGKNFVSES